MDFLQISQELIRSIRNVKSQAWVNSRMNSKSNILNRWENGHTKASWIDFILFCKIMKVELITLINRYFRYNANIEDSGALLTHIFSSRSLSQLEITTQISRSKLVRLKSGETALTLDIFVQIIFTLDPQESLAFFYDLTSNNSIASLDHLEEKRLSISREYLKDPQFGLALVCLHLPNYQKLTFHQDSFIEALTGIPIKRVNEIFSFCLENEIIEVENGLYKMTKFRLSDRGNKDEMINARRFWMQKAIDKTFNRSDKDAFGSLVFCTSQPARDQIISLYLKFFEDLKNVVDNDTSEDKIPLILNFQLFTPKD